MMGIEIKGAEKLAKKLKKNCDLGMVKKVVRYHGAALQRRAMRIVPVDKGHLKDSIGLEITDGGLTATVEPTEEYASYVEYGTRFMNAQPYMRPSLEEQGAAFKADLGRLVK